MKQSSNKEIMETPSLLKKSLSKKNKNQQDFFLHNKMQKKENNTVLKIL